MWYFLNFKSLRKNYFWISIPNSSGKNLGQTFSIDATTLAASFVPICTASSNDFPYVKPITSPEQKASPAPVVSLTWTFWAGHMP